MKKVIGYSRVSTEMQVVKGNSIVNQKDKIKDFCRMQDLDLVDILIDKGISGRTKDKRGEYLKLINLIECGEGIDGVVVYSLSRLGRNMKDVVEFLDLCNKKKVTFYCVKENLSNGDMVGSLILNILSSINEFECEVIRDRIQDVKRNKKRRGEVYGKEMFGFDNVDGRLVENKNEKDIIKYIKNLRRRGFSWNKISERLNEKGIKTKKGKKWYSSTCYNMIKNESWIGVGK